MSEGISMANYPEVTRAPFDVDCYRWLAGPDGRQFPIIALTRRRVVVACGDRRITLKRRNLQTAGHDVARDGAIFYVTAYALPDQDEPQEIAS